MAASLLCMAKPVPTYASSLSDQLQEARDAQPSVKACVHKQVQLTLQKLKVRVTLNLPKVT